MAISQFYWHLVVNNGNFTLLLISIGQEWQFLTTTYDILWSRLAISHFYWNLVVKFGRWTFFTWWTPQYQWRDTLNTSTKNLPDEPTLADGPPTCWMAISHCYWHLVVKNGNFTLLLTSIGQEWEFHIAAGNLWSRMAIWHCYLHQAVKNGNFTLLLTSHGQIGNFMLLLTSCGWWWQFHITTDM